MGQDSVVHLILHHAADRRKRLEHEWNKSGTRWPEKAVDGAVGLQYASG
jgi:hypothetical protein